MSDRSHQELLVQSLTEFSDTLLVTYDLDTVLEDLAARLNTLLGLDGTGITLEQAGRLQVAGALPVELATLERVQVDKSSGPCIDALRTGRVAASADLRQESRWPAYRAAAGKAGIAAVAGVPLKLQERTFGAMDLYSCAARAWTEEDLMVARVLAHMATGYLVNSAKLRQHQELAEQLQRALDTRVIIEQAKGIVAQARGVDVEVAFELIRGYARTRNRRVREVAAAVVHLGLLP